MGGALRIVHLASLARSGETLLQRALGAHSQVHVVADLHEPNDETSQRLFRLLRVWPLPVLPRWQVERHLAPGAVAPGTRVLLVKQGVFAPRHAAPGFALLRNPYAIFCSLWHYDAGRSGRVDDAATNAEHWRRLRLPRLLVWADAIDPGLAPLLQAEPDPVRQFLHFWRVKAAQILASHRLRVHYEDLVADPAAALRSLCAGLDLPYDPAMLRSHEAYAPGTIGHGGIDLGQPIHAAADWTPDPQVPLQPFVDAVRASPLRRYHGLYLREAVPC